MAAYFSGVSFLAKLCPANFCSWVEAEALLQFIEVKFRTALRNPTSNSPVTSWPTDFSGMIVLAFAAVLLSKTNGSGQHNPIGAKLSSQLPMLKYLATDLVSNPMQSSLYFLLFALILVSAMSKTLALSAPLAQNSDS